MVSFLSQSYQNDFNNFTITCLSFQGAHRRVGEGVEYDIRKIIVHEGYIGGVHKDHDIALLKLAKPALLDKTVNTICLPKHNEIVPVGNKCYVTGQ